jgi:ribonuclease-3
MSPIEDRINYTFQDPALLDQALTHPSCGGTFFQRLEFLGDRVLGLTIAQWLLDEFPNDPEGALTKRLANMVNRTALNRIAHSLDLGYYVKSDTESTRNSRVMADTCEAILGAIYLDTGLGSAQSVIKKLWINLLHECSLPPIDAKSALQEYLQGEKRPLPLYTLVGQRGPSHQPIFETRLDIAPDTSFTGTGQSKRDAEQQAAQCALDYYLRS